MITEVWLVYTMIHQVLNYQEMSVWSSPLPWCGRSRSGLGSSTWIPFIHPLLLPGRGGERRRVLWQDRQFHCIFICKMCVRNPVCLQEMCLLSDVNAVCAGVHSRYGLRATMRVVWRVSAGWYHCLLTLHCSWGAQVHSQPLRLCVWHTLEVMQNAAREKCRNLVVRQQSWVSLPAGPSLLLLPAPDAKVSWFLLEKESLRCVCKQIAELAQEIWLYQYCPTVSGLMVCTALFLLDL